MGHVIEHIALEIQTLAGMNCGFGRTRQTSTKGVYNVVFNYWEAKAGVYAAKASVAIAEALIEGRPYHVEDDIQKLREIREEERLGPSTGSIVEEAFYPLKWSLLGPIGLWHQSKKNTSYCGKFNQQHCR